MRVDNRLERWVDTDPAEARRYHEFRDRFGSDEFVVVALSGVPLFDAESLDAMVAAQERLEAVPGVTRVDSLAAVYRDLFGGEDPEALEAEATSTPFYRGLLLSDDSKVTAMLVEVDPVAEPEARHRIVSDLRRAVEPLEAQGFSVELVGSTVLVDALDELSRREALAHLPGGAGGLDAGAGAARAIVAWDGGGRRVLRGHRAAHPRPDGGDRTRAPHDVVGAAVAAVGARAGEQRPRPPALPAVARAALRG